MIKDLFYLLISDYWENIQPDKFNSLSPLTGEENWFTALRHFKDYAYERNVSGAARRYREIANKALATLQTGRPTTFDLDEEARIWDEFQLECEKHNIKPNMRVDPLKPSNGEKQSLVRFVREVSSGNDKTVAAWAFRMVSENKLKEAHSRLKTVWGVGDKIASFYLRDIFWLGHQLDPKVTVEDDYLLQPVDIWVERAAQALGHDQKSRTSIAKFISSFEKESGIAHGGGNIACWMLGSNYLFDLGSFGDVLKAIANPGSEHPNALSIAVRFEEVRGRFGAMLKDIILHTESKQSPAGDSC